MLRVLLRTPEMMLLANPAPFLPAQPPRLPVGDASCHPVPDLLRIVVRKTFVTKPDGQARWAACVEAVARERDRQAFAELFDHYAPRIKSYLRQQGASDELAEDLSQEAMLTLWRKAKQFDSTKAAVSTWLFRIARNLMIDRLRRERGIAYELEDVAAEIEVEGNQLERAEADALRDRLRALPAAQAEVVYKSYFEGKSHGEIAGETGQPLGSVKSRLRLALRSLRRDLGAEVP